MTSDQLRFSGDPSMEVRIVEFVDGSVGFQFTTEVVEYDWTESRLSIIDYAMSADDARELAEWITNKLEERA